VFILNLKKVFDFIAGAVMTALGVKLVFGVRQYILFNLILWAVVI